MTLIHPHPKIAHTPDGLELWHSVQRWTKDVKDGEEDELNTLPTRNFEEILKKCRAFGPIKTPAVRGKYLEMCVYDLVARVVAGEDKDLSLVETNVDMKPGYHAEADILINERLALLLKVSYRERWKQVDRDALLMTVMRGGQYVDPESFRVWSVFNSEHDTDTFRQAQKKAASVQRQCHAPLTVATIKDSAKMSELISCVKWSVEEAKS